MTPKRSKKDNGHLIAHIILNQSVGDEGWNTPMLNAIYETEIDWIKVYQ